MSVVESDLEGGARPRRLTVLHVTAPALVGGLERVVEALAAGHAGAGHDVHVAAVIGSEDVEPPFLEILRTRGVVVHVLRVSAQAYRAERAFIAQLCRVLKPDVVHTHGYRSDVIDGAVARRAGIPTITTVHGFTRGRGKARLYEWLQRRSHRRFDAVVAVSGPQTDELIAAGVPREKLFLLQNAWSDSRDRMSRAAARAALGIPDDQFQIGWVGRLSEEKGPDLLIRAIHHLASRTDAAFGVSIIGDGPVRAQVQSAAASYGLDRHVRWHGVVEDAGRYFEAFDVFVISSRTEGTPIVLFEAMAAGVPIVSTAVGGIPDVLGEDSALLTPADDTQALADAILQIQRHPDQARQRVQAAGKTLHARFDADRWLAEYESLYIQLEKNNRFNKLKTNR